MEQIKVDNLSFSYPNGSAALEDITLSVKKGEFITLCGKSGCGKTTLLRLLKPSVSPFGNISGNILFEGKNLKEYSERDEAEKIGFVMQSPENQIVTDKVWHELAFGLESLGLKTEEIRARVSEMASFFGIGDWFYKKTSELSGGQKQILNLASVMVIGPSVLILDEPTSQLDPIASQEFLNVLKKINRELGTTIILSEHRLEEAIPICDRVLVMDEGRIIAEGKSGEVYKKLKGIKHPMERAFPAPMRIFGTIDKDGNLPDTVCGGRERLISFAENNPLFPEAIKKSEPQAEKEYAIEIKDAFFRYEKNMPDVLKGLNIKVPKGGIYAILGGNGSGKTTALSVMCGINTPYRGSVLIGGKPISKIGNLYSGILGVLPQNPQTLFVKKTVYLDLLEVLQDEEKVHAVASVCRIENLLQSHPYDLSGGEQQRAALAKVLLKEPEILLLDEPTKGMDAHFKETFADILESLKKAGKTIVLVSHDIEFCAEYADTCALMFDGAITSKGAPREFFKGKNFYTTSSNRMARELLPDAILPEDVIVACGHNAEKREKESFNFKKSGGGEPLKEKKTEEISVFRIISGLFFAVLFFLTNLLSQRGIINLNINTVRGILVAETICALLCFFGGREVGAEIIQQEGRHLSKRTLVAMLLILIFIPLTLYIGIFYLDDRKYYITSLFIILETIVPFAMVFESRKPGAREIVIISVLCAITVAGRAAFFMLPQFKPVIALVIISGVCFGGEAGFLVGAVSAFISNFYFGQGPWTPWQMFSMGIIGFIAGILFRKGLIRKTKASLCIFGALATLLIYGGIMNPASVISYQPNPTKEMLLMSYVAGFSVDLIHAISTAVFLWFISEPMIEKLERIKIKYGLLE